MAWPALTSWTAALPSGFKGYARSRWPRLAPERGGPSPADHDRADPRPHVRYDATTGVLEVVDPRLIRPESDAFCRHLAAAAVGQGGASLAVLDPESHTCAFRFDPARFDAEAAARGVERAVRLATESVRAEREPAARRDWWNLTLGVGSLVVAAAGVVLPGIPAAPFLIVSVHSLVKASPALRGWLARRPRLASIVRRIEAAKRPTLNRRTLLNTAGLMILVGLLLVLVHPPLPLVLAVELGVTLALGLRELGGLEWLTGEASAALG